MDSTLIRVFEKTKLRDNSLSHFHRQLNQTWYMSDMDHVLYDYNYDVIAIFEEKHFNISEKTLLKYYNTQYQVQLKIANAVNAPLFLIIKHYPETPSGDLIPDGYFTFYIRAENQKAREILKQTIGKTEDYFSERRYYKLEAYLRQCTPDQNILNKLSSKIFKFKKF